MDMNIYQALAMRTNSTKNDNFETILNASLGLSGESGEVADLLKKNLYQGHDLPKEKIMDETGDILWYCALMAEGLGVNLSQIAEYNIEKLKRRYPQGFDREKSINREEKKQ